jgi:hypothetical protein
LIVAIHQPQYLPWLGYFHKIDQADVFILLDNVQYKKNEWQNRNKIKTANGWQWLSIPVHYKFPEKINKVKIDHQKRWQHKQRQAIISNYNRAHFFPAYQDFLTELTTTNWANLAEVNIFTVRELAKLLDIKTSIIAASELGDFPIAQDERLINLIQHLNAKTYLAGQGGKDYMQLGKYRQAGIEVIFQQFQHPVYRQLFNGFEPYLSVIDLLFNYGPGSMKIIRGDK